MKTTLDYLNQVIKKQVGIENDNQLATYLGITRQAIHQYKQGQNMSVLVAIKVAFELEIHPLETVSATLYAQAKNDLERDFWREQYERITVTNRI
jgi:predicted transcriptional regulator